MFTLWIQRHSKSLFLRRRTLEKRKEEEKRVKEEQRQKQQEARKKLLEEQVKGAGAPLSRKDATAERIDRLLRRYPNKSLNVISKLYFGVELPNHNRNWHQSSDIAKAIRYRLDKNNKPQVMTKQIVEDAIRKFGVDTKFSSECSSWYGVLTNGEKTSGLNAPCYASLFGHGGNLKNVAIYLTGPSAGSKEEIGFNKFWEWCSTPNEHNPWRSILKEPVRREYSELCREVHRFSCREHL